MNYKIANGKLVWELSFSDQSTTAEFVLAVARLADAANHHPDMLLHRWNQLRIELCSHDVNSITERDYKLADQIDRLLAGISS